MAKISKYIEKKNIKMRVLSVALIIAILCGSFAWFGSSDMENVVASGTTKPYMQYVMDLITNGTKPTFNIVEIVPYDGFGEWRYYLNRSEVVTALESQQTLIDDWCTTSDKTWKTLSGNGFANFGYQIRYNEFDKDNKKYEIKGNDSFIAQLFGEQAGVLSDRIDLKTIEANNLTEADIESADLIVFSTAPHDAGTLNLYKAWKQLTTDPVFYTSAGASGAESTNAYYDTFELVDGAYVSRDMSEAVCNKLLDYTINGKSITLSNGNVVQPKVPVILDSTQINVLKPGSNVYKFNLIYRTLCGGNTVGKDPSELYTTLKNYISTKNITDLGVAGASVLNDCLDGFGIIKNCFDVGNDSWLTDYLFVYKGDKLLTTLADVEEETKRIIYFDNTFGWGEPYAHYWTPGGSETSWPGVKMTHVGGSVYSVEVASDTTMIIFSNKGNPQTGDITLKAGKNYYKDSDNNLDYEESSWGTYSGGTGSSEINYSSGKGVSDRTGGAGAFADVAQFLLGCKAKQVGWYNYGDKVKVLEVQPSNSFLYYDFDTIKALGQKLLIAGSDTWSSSNYKNYIDVTRVTTNALNGMTNDLVADYDIIIIGDKTGILNVDDSGKTIYNDRKLNGYVYLAYGDLFKIATNALGILPDEYEVLRPGYDTSNLVTLNSANAYNYTKYVYESLTKNKIYVSKLMQDQYQGKTYSDTTGSFYTGDNSWLGNVRGVDNDITDKTKAKLVKFAQSGKTIILTEGLYNLDSYKVYPTSDMHEYCKMLGTIGTDGNRLYSVYSDKYISGAVNQRYTANPTVTFVKDATGKDIKPLEPAYTSGVISQFGSRDLYYKFNITGQAGKTYKIKLFVDKNSDGVYKQIDSGILDENELYYSNIATIPANANTITYEIKSMLAENFVGMLAWKIEVIQLDDAHNETSYSTSIKGYSAIKNETAKKIRVLQINHQDKVRYWSDGSGKIINPVTLDMKNDESFKSLLSDTFQKTLGYEITIDVLSTSQYEAKFKSSPYKLGEDIGTSKDKLSEYDMVVIGFGDLFGAYGDHRNEGEPVSSDISNKYGALDNIKDFIDIGKAVLFTHDTTSWRVTPNRVANGSSGRLDMWYTTLLWENGTIAVQGSQDKEYFKRYQETFYDDFAHNITVALRDQVGLDKYGITLPESERTDNEKPMYASSSLAPDYASNLEVRELHGFTPWFYYRNNFLLKTRHEYVGSGNGMYTLEPFDDYDVSFAHDRSTAWTTTQVVRLNEGCITKYPYLIDEEIKVANTHGQYYSVNMEDEDVVVWFTLTDDGSAPSRYYGKTEKDAENNYYIYSKDNITYSGAGHSEMDDFSTDMERKLFVNTIIKAIAGGNNAPVLTITNGAYTSEGHTVYINSANSAKDYEIHILGTDADLVSPESADGNLALVGNFKTAEVYWNKDDGTKQLIKTYTQASPLKNGVISELKLGDTDLTPAELKEIEKLVEGIDGVGATEAKFEIVISDWLNATAKVNVRLVKRDMFQLD